MQITDFKTIVSTFADPGSEILFDGQKVLISVNGDLIDVRLSMQSGDIYVTEGEIELPASRWIVTRLARLPLLATRLKDTIAETANFVSSAASLLPSLRQRPEDTSLQTNDALNAALETLAEPSPLETTVLYITSDAGEGKTSLINQLAREQAIRFSSRQADWLLVPIPLGGRHFLRFDDITVGVLQNRYRFPALYYDSFLALVRMGVIIPAFDGFEEMLVESSSGEALSAMGILLGSLNSQGTMIIAARKAYFEFENLSSQERLYDTISSYAVGFGKLELRRWSEEQFLQYCKKRDVVNAVQIYQSVSERLGKEHSLLTRPVLVRRLVDIAIQSVSLDAFLQRIQASGADFFSVFIRGIVEREANEKWLDRSGELGIGLLSVDEHCELLAQIALAMWDARVDYLKQDMLEFVADDFCEGKRKSAFQAQQIRERIRGHALLVASPNAAKAVEFDHEEFRLFFLGEGLATIVRPMTERSKLDALNIFRKGSLPRDSQRAFIRAIKRDQNISRLEAAKFLLTLVSLDGTISFTQENCSDLIIRLFSEIDGGGTVLKQLTFSPDSLRDRSLLNTVFDGCHFAPTSLEISQFKDCRFVSCTFSQLRFFDSTVCENIVFENCKIDSIHISERELDVWDPQAICTYLQSIGIHVEPVTSQKASTPDITDPEMEQEIVDFEKLVRYFMRSTQIGDSLLTKKLGHHTKPFIEQTLPKLLEAGILEEIEHRGGGTPQRRFKLAISLREVNQALADSKGDFNVFLALCQSHHLT